MYVVSQKGKAVYISKVRTNFYNFAKCMIKDICC